MFILKNTKNFYNIVLNTNLKKILFSILGFLILIYSFSYLVNAGYIKSNQPNPMIDEIVNSGFVDSYMSHIIQYIVNIVASFYAFGLICIMDNLDEAFDYDLSTRKFPTKILTILFEFVIVYSVLWSFIDSIKILMGGNV